jgi:TRAP-type C4-dicarboxylate transport system permease small subunit
LNSLARGFEIVLSYLFVFSVALNFVNAIARYLLGFTIEGSDDVAVYIMVAVVFLGFFVVTWRGQHLRMDVIAEKLPRRLQVVLGWIELLLLLALSAFVAFQSFSYASLMFELGGRSDTAHIPTWIAHATVPIGFGLAVIVTLWRILTRSVAQEAIPPKGRPS